MAKFVGWGGLPQVFDEENAIKVENGEAETRRKTASEYERYGFQYENLRTTYREQADGRDDPEKPDGTGPFTLSVTYKGDTKTASISDPGPSSSCVTTHVATITVYATEQPDGTYFEITTT